MRRAILVFVAVLMVGSVSFAGEPLKVGDKAPDFAFEDADGKVFTNKTWAGKVLLVNYVDPDESDLNEHFTDAMKKASNEGLLTKADYKGIGIVDCAATWKPDFLIRQIAGDKAKKYETIIIFDYDAVMRESWGLKEDTANAILLDKQGIVQYINMGRVPDEEVDKVVQLAIDLQTK